MGQNDITKPKHVAGPTPHKVQSLEDRELQVIKKMHADLDKEAVRNKVNYYQSFNYNAKNTRINGKKEDCRNADHFSKLLIGS